MERRVLVHAHRDLAALLHSVVGGVLGVEGERDQEHEQEETDARRRQFRYRLHTAITPPQVFSPPYATWYAPGISTLRR